MTASCIEARRILEEGRTGMMIKETIFKNTRITKMRQGCSKVTHLKKPVPVVRTGAATANPLRAVHAEEGVLSCLELHAAVATSC